MKIGYLNVGVDIMNEDAIGIVLMHCVDTVGKWETHMNRVLAKTIKCANCGGEHVATSWKREKEIVTIKYKESLSFPETRKIVNIRFSLNNMYSTVAKSNVSAPKEMKKCPNTDF